MARLVARHLRQVKVVPTVVIVWSRVPVILDFSLIHVGQLEDDDDQVPLLSGTARTRRSFTTVEVNNSTLNTQLQTANIYDIFSSFLDTRK